MPNRILKDSICTSDNLNALTPEQEVFWYRLLVQCDDYGRMDARPAILRAKCFPLKLETISDADISDWLGVLRDAALILLYSSGGKPYLQVTTWEDHQQIRAKRSKYPPMISDDINGNQKISNVPENPIQDESESESKTKQDAQVVVVNPYAMAIKNFENEIGLVSGSYADDMKDMWTILESAGTTGWWDKAIKLSVEANKRSWSYMRGILSNCLQEGHAPGERNGTGGQHATNRRNGSGTGKPFGLRRDPNEQPDREPTAEERAEFYAATPA